MPGWCGFGVFNHQLIITHSLALWCYVCFFTVLRLIRRLFPAFAPDRKFSSAPAAHDRPAVPQAATPVSVRWNTSFFRTECTPAAPPSADAGTCPARWLSAPFYEASPSACTPHPALTALTDSENRNIAPSGTVFQVHARRNVPWIHHRSASAFPPASSCDSGSAW